MEIEYKGANCVVISTKKTKLIVDPKLSIVGLKDVSTKDAIQVATEARFATDSSDALLNVTLPGEYEVSDFSIKGIAAQRHIDTINQPKQATVYRIEVGDVRFGIIGNIDGKLSEDQQEALGILDVVILPVGGNGYTLDATSAATLLRSLDVKVVIPVHYADTGLTYEVAQDELSTFVKEFGGEVEQSSKYKLKGASSLPQVPTVIELQRA